MSTTLTETLRERRGHDFYEWPAEMPGFGANDNVDAPDIMIWAHYFGPSQDWWLAEIERDTGMAWGYCQLFGKGTGEWGDVYLPELEAIYPNVLTIIERDCYWTPRRWDDIQG